MNGARVAYPVGDLRAFLEGRWQLRKVGLSGGPHPTTMRFLGTATFIVISAGLELDERGVMTTGRYRGEAVRRYLFREVRAAMAQVCFDDGRLFHELSLGNGFAQVRHDCAPDLYTGRYRVLAPDRWLLSWRIVGPRKDQRIVSVFSRIVSG